LFPESLEDATLVCRLDPVAVGEFDTTNFYGNRFGAGCSVFQHKAKAAVSQLFDLPEEKEIAGIDFLPRLS
jgi:hypothetical protein